jgi:hypothetical protein
MARAIAYHRLHGRDDLADAFEAELALAGRCRRCGRALSDPESVRRGVGPDCYLKDHTKETR